MADKTVASELDRVLGKITTDISNKADESEVTSLSAEIATLEGTVADKADASALNNYLPKTGGTIDGMLNIQRGTTDWGQFTITDANGRVCRIESATNGVLRIDNRDTTSANDRRYLEIRNTPKEASDAYALKFGAVHGGTGAEHNIYGEHNVTRSTTDIGAGATLASGTIYLVYE